MKLSEPTEPELSLSQRELFERIGWFTQVRWGAGILALIFIALGWFAFRVKFAVAPASGVIGALFVYNAVFAVSVRRLYRGLRIRRRAITNLAHAQITCDLLAVAALVYFIGGVENHFILLFIFPMIVASEFFRPRTAYLYATLAAGLINLIGWGGYFSLFPHYTLSVFQGTAARTVPLISMAAAHRWIFVMQVTFVMTFSVYVTVFIAGSIAARLRMREEELEQAYRNLQSLEQLKSEFMLRAGHELRAPVGAVQSLLKAAVITMPEKTDQARDLITRAVARSDNMLDMIGDLIHYSRLRSVELKANFQTIDLAEVARSSAELFRAQAQGKGIDFEIETFSAPVRGDRDSLADLANNLLSNAVRYTSTGGRVSLRVAEEEGACRLVVSDTGIGIPEDELPHIFEEFFRGREAKKTARQGTGLGMSIVRRVLDVHGGRISIESRSGRGTTFRIAFPPADAYPKSIAR